MEHLELHRKEIVERTVQVVVVVEVVVRVLQVILVQQDQIFHH
jgi:hypothetical protein